jgi:hypothetical protein
MKDEILKHLYDAKDAALAIKMAHCDIGKLLLVTFWTI